MEPKQFRHFINGEFVGSTKTFEKRRPTDNALIGHVHEGGQAEVDAAVAAGKAAMKGPWSTMSVEQRVDLLHKVADEITRRFEDFVIAERDDIGQPRSMLEHVAIPRGAANFKTFADMVKNVPTESFLTPTPDGAGALNYAIRVPKGVIGVVCPWNMPLLLMTWKVGPALACGNTVVVKPSEETPGTATLLGEVMNAVGVPKGVYNVVHGFGPNSAGEFLTKHKNVAAITFTGETRTGAAIMKAASDGIRDVSFELGGKNAGIVFADCDFDKAVEGIARAAFLNCGQVCLGTERVYVERPIFDKFVAALKVKAESIKPGAPDEKSTGLGPLISAEHQRKVLVLRKGEGRRREHRHRRLCAADARRAGERALGAADDLDRPAGNRERDPRRNLRALLPHRALRFRGRGHRQGQRHRLRSLNHDLDDESFARASRRRADRGRHYLDQ